MVRALFLTDEFPPTSYGGAGVHVAELTRHLRPLCELDVRTFGAHDETADGWRVQGYPAPHDVSRASPQLRPLWATLSRDVGFAAEPVTADVVHCHTWY